jgi:hypothetical protein
MLATPSPDALQHPEWLGVWIGDTRAAFPTTAIHAVFSTQISHRDDTMIAPLDIQVHAGVPVFLMPLIDWLPRHFESEQALPPGEPQDIDGTWVVAFQPGGADTQASTPSVGCRVQGIRGPFRASPEAGHVEMDGVRWPIWTPCSPA